MRFSILILSTLFLSSCVTYTMSLESFKQQFAGIDSTKLVKVRISGGTGGVCEYWANPVKEIECVDRTGQSGKIKNWPSISIRFTYGPKKKRTTFYSDRVMVIDTMVVGGNSRYVPSLRHSIPLKAITKIEVINDGKPYYKLD